MENVYQLKNALEGVRYANDVLVMIANYHFNGMPFWKELYRIDKEKVESYAQMLSLVDYIKIRFEITEELFRCHENIKPIVKDIIGLFQGLYSYVGLNETYDSLTLSGEIVNNFDNLPYNDDIGFYLLDCRQALNGVLSILEEKCKDFGYNLNDIDKRFGKCTIPTKGEERIRFSLSPELDTPRAREIFKKAIEKGLMEETSSGYNWKDTSKARFAYLCERLYLRDENNKDKGKGKPFPETALNKLFDVTRLSKERYQYSGNKNTNGKPKGYEIIDRLFEESSR